MYKEFDFNHKSLRKSPEECGWICDNIVTRNQPYSTHLQMFIYKRHLQVSQRPNTVKLGLW